MEEPLGYSEQALTRFGSRLVRLWDRDGFDVEDAVGTARLLTLLLRQQGMDSPAAAQLLVDTGIRDRWNKVFAEGRSAVAAEWIAPHLGTPWLDVLAGDFTLTRGLARIGGQPAVAVERRSAYQTDWAGLDFPVIDLDELGGLRGQAFDTAFLGTVLHHERDFGPLLEQLAALDCRRWLVAENCLDAENDEEFHLLVDEFFNRCLNTFDVPCVPQHRTREGWMAALSEYGTVTHVGQRAAMPGIPFPYDLFLVERTAR
ncbi:hypothetical protein [Micromonospora sp. NPDC023644]|uniref:hypothetical protein n=1 Tax=Micromonospora sp. NPDC023644 TaxID=3154321 RepID=UPI0033ED1616